MIETERLLLRPLTEEDASAVFAYSKVAEVGYNAGWKPHESLDETREIMTAVFLHQEGVYGMVEKERGLLIGTLGLIEDGKRENPKARMLGYALAKEFWGKGYMTEAAEALLACARKHWDAELISAYCYPFNHRSKRVLKKLGFVYEGTLHRCEAHYSGKVFDNECYYLSLK